MTRPSSPQMPLMSSDLTGKVALVTGASGGIGTALAEALVERGATVVATSRSITARSARTGRRGWSTRWGMGKAKFIGVLPGTDVTSDHPVVAFILGSVHAYDLASGAHLAAGTLGDNPPSWSSLESQAPVMSMSWT